MNFNGFEVFLRIIIFEMKKIAICHVLVKPRVKLMIQNHLTGLLSLRQIFRHYYILPFSCTQLHSATQTNFVIHSNKVCNTVFNWSH